LKVALAGARDRAIDYLLGEQRGDGSWVPLWFGNQNAPNKENALYGTTRVMLAPIEGVANVARREAWFRAHRRALHWVLSSQNTDGGWGGTLGVTSTVEETALAVEALACAGAEQTGRVAAAIDRGCAWLIDRTEEGTHFPSSPIGLYFAKLWYSEQLYPLIFTVGALGRVSRGRRVTRKVGVRF
jgi:squalene-hopene/tetraprenyl-beta-curcumene cyclase